MPRPGTLVSTIDGPRPIEDLRVGNLVAARDEVTGEFGWHEVAALMTREAPGILRLTLAGPDGATEVLRVTGEHPLYLEGRGWAEAGEVSAGDAIRDREGHPLRVLSVARDETPTRVHNLEVAGAHTYFAGALEAWGHNAKSLGGNPFAGKAWWQIAQMFRSKGFEPVGFKKTPCGCRREWKNPKTGFRYFFDCGTYEGYEHVDVVPPSGSRATKRRLPL